jgi:hypothetical protein
MEDADLEPALPPTLVIAKMDTKETTATFVSTFLSPSPSPFFAHLMKPLSFQPFATRSAFTEESASGLIPANATHKPLDGLGPPATSVSENLFRAALLQQKFAMKGNERNLTFSVVLFALQLCALLDAVLESVLLLLSATALTLTGLETAAKFVNQQTKKQFL